MIIKKTNIFIIALLTIFILPNVSAHEPVDPGVTPDSFLWGIDKALDNLNLLLTLNPTNKAIKGIAIARERLEEIKVMTEENKIDKAEKAKNEHIKLLSKVKQSISEIEEKNSTTQIEQEIEIEREIEEHEEEVEELSTNLKIKIEAKGNLSEEQKALIESILSALENKTGEVKIEIKNKKEETKIKIKTETGKSEREIEEEIDGIEEEKGLSGIKKEKAVEEIEDANEDLEELEKELEEHKSEGHIDNETSITTLIGNAKEKMSKAEEALQNNDFGEAFGQANAAKQLIENAENVLDKIVKKFEEEEEEQEMEEEREIEVEIKDGEAKVKVEIGDEKLKFTMQTTDKNAIIQEIASRTGLSVDEVTKLAKFEEGKGILQGKVTIGPICPVEIESVPCEVKPEVYKARKIIIYSQDKSSIVKEIDLDKGGGYKTDLSPGNYVADINYIGIDRSRDVPKEIKIESEKTVKLDIDIDNGVR